MAWALALAVVGYPIHRRINARFKRSSFAAGVSVTVVALILIAPAIFVTNQIAEQAVANYDRLMDEVKGERWKTAIQNNPRFAPLLQWIENHVDIEQELKRTGERVAANVGYYVKGSVWAIAELLITLFVLFYFFRDRKQMLDLLRGLVPLSNAESKDVFTRVVDTINATIFGTVVVAMIQGALGGLMFWWLGLPGPLLWGVVMGLLAIIPILGAFVIWVPAAIFLAVHGEIGKALLLTVWGTVVIGLIDNLLYPVLVGNRLRLHTLPVFFAIVGGLFVFGVAGVILGPLAFAMAVALIDIWRIRTAQGKPAEKALNPSEQVDEPLDSESKLVRN
jgi:predicted PurR-regulated permease PerM